MINGRYIGAIYTSFSLQPSMSISSSDERSKSFHESIHESFHDPVGEVRIGIQRFIESFLHSHRKKTKWFFCCGSKSILENELNLIERAERISDQEIMRLLLANENNPEHACKHAIETLYARRDFGVDMMLGSSAEFRAQDEAGSLYWRGKDLHGDPVLIACMRNHDPSLFSVETTVR